MLMSSNRITRSLLIDNHHLGKSIWIYKKMLIMLAYLEYSRPSPTFVSCSGAVEERDARLGMSVGQDGVRLRAWGKTG